MLPIRDRNRSGITPWATYGLIAANVAVFLYEFSLPQEDLQALVSRYGFVARQATAALRGEAGLMGALVIPAFTCMFLHGGLAHVLGNMWFLHIFGDNVEARLGRAPYVAFYLLCGLAASAAQYILNPGSSVPIIGASGAIAGVLGAYIVCWPRARVLTLVPLFFLFYFVELPAVVMLGFWFLMQFLLSAASLGAGAVPGVAYWAHVGGFVTGAAVMFALRGRTGGRRPRHRRDERARGRDRWRR